MSYTTRNNGNITDFWPDDTEDTIYLTDYGMSISDLIDKANDKWPNVSLDDITISAEKIHTSCLYYDLYDGGDWTNFIVLTRN